MVPKQGIHLSILMIRALSLVTNPKVSASCDRDEPHSLVFHKRKRALSLPQDFVIFSVLVHVFG